MKQKVRCKYQKMEPFKWWRWAEPNFRNFWI